MKAIRTLKACVFILICSAAYAQNPGVAIDEENNPPDASAMLDVRSGSRGVLLPRVPAVAFTDTSLSIGANPALSLLAFDSTRLGYFFFNGNGWERLMSSSSDGGRLLDSAPTGSSDAMGSVGDMAFDSNYFYIKTGAGWRRFALSAF